MISPLLLLATAYAGGVIVADHFNIGAAALLALLSGVLAGGVFAYRMKAPLRIAWATIAFLLLGAFLTSLSANRLESGALYRAAQQSEYVTAEGILIGDPAYSSGSARFDLRVTGFAPGRDFDTGPALGEAWRVSEKLRVKVRSGNPLKLYSGQPVRVSGSLEVPESSGDFDYRRYLYHRGITSVLTARPEEIREAASTPSRTLVPLVLAGKIKHWVRQAYFERLPGDCAGLLCGIVLGDISTIGEEIEEVFRVTGLSHILAASGANIAIIVAALWPILRLLRLRAGAQVALLFIATAAYTMVSGMSPSISRAFVMAAIGLLAWLLGHERHALNALATTVLALMVLDPFILYDIGFQLSFAATAALIIFTPEIERHMEDVPKSIRSGLAVTIAAQIGVLPILVYYFGQVSIISLVANLVIVPLTAPALILGMAILPIQVLLPLLATPAFLVLEMLVGGILLLARLFGGMPGASITLSQPSMPVVIGSYAILGILGLALHRIKLRLRFIHVILLVIGVVGVGIAVQATRVLGPSQLEMTFLDVGQGDSALIRAPDGSTILIDSGPKPDTIKRKLHERGIAKIDAVFISHEHADHTAGLKEIFKAIPTGSFIYPREVAETGACSQLAKAAKRHGVTCEPLDDRDTIRVGRHLVVRAFCADEADESDYSAVLMVTYGRFSALFTGDAGTEVEEALVAGGKPLDADVLKVGHHGSAGSSGREFVRRVSPAVSVVSVGRGNMYGHPSRAALGRLSAEGSKIYRTDRNGDVTINSDGETFSVYTEK